MSEVSDILSKGLSEVYSVFFDKKVEYRLLETLSTNSVYQEEILKEYSEPFYVLAKVSPYNTEDNPVPVANPIGVLNFKTPIKALEDINLTKDTSTLKRGKFVYEGKSYRVLSITKGLNIDGIFLTYLFTCEEDIR